jgi:hypothetical protein
MKIETKNINKINIDIIITIVARRYNERGVQRLYQTTFLVMSRIQAKPACLPLDLA